MEANENINISVSVLKNHLIDKLKEVNDENILEDVLAFIEFEVSSDKNVHLSPDQISRIEESRKQIQSGKYLTQEEVEQRMKEWIKK
ncbi:hypothetical protein KUV50_06645 [Membranicola marinus]|uniref:Addiction module component, TIGR02574 family n=1 Tax=Membranihabitans marinus TaxID=1227546 RepID=A0A953HSW8_9BACT|nr:hypothetical protein [Membranihabitans marinus]MBY5957800.1 hypothetical protein [Membranihabitans marinus]